MDTTERIEKLSRSESIAQLVSRLSVTASSAEAILQAFARISRIDNAPARELYIFAGAIARAHERNALRYRIAIAS